MVRRLLALSDDLGALARPAPDGTAPEASEAAVPQADRDLNAQIPADAVARVRSTPSKGFRRSRTAPVSRLGVAAMAAVQALGDGASRIRKSVNCALTGCTRTPDIGRAGARLSRCARAIVGAATAVAAVAFARARDLLRSDGWSGVCARVAEVLSVGASAEPGRRRPATEKRPADFAKRGSRLTDRERLARGRGIGSGVAEGRAKTPGRRSQCRGARWRRADVRPMASLACVRNSAQWEAYWTPAA